MLEGRDQECERLRRVLVNAVRGTPEILVIRGEPGMGKAHLLRAAAEDAHEPRVLRVDGHEAETEISYAGLSMPLGSLMYGLRTQNS